VASVTGLGLTCGNPQTLGGGGGGAGAGETPSATRTTAFAGWAAPAETLLGPTKQQVSVAAAKITVSTPNNALFERFMELLLPGELAPIKPLAAKACW